MPLFLPPASRAAAPPDALEPFRRELAITREEIEALLERVHDLARSEQFAQLEARRQRRLSALASVELGEERKRRRRQADEWAFRLMAERDEARTRENTAKMILQEEIAARVRAERAAHLACEEAKATRLRANELEREIREAFARLVARWWQGRRNRGSSKGAA